MYTITRQHQSQDSTMIVEISEGSFDYVNPDMLSERYDHEGETFADPRDAVNAAIEIYNLWRADEPGTDIYIGYGNTLGYTLPFEASTVKELKEWSNKEYESIDKCDWCGDILPNEREIWQLIDIDDMRFCSETCADNAHSDMMKEN